MNEFTHSEPELQVKVENQSPEIGKLALSLSKAQGMIEGAKQDSENPYFKSKYADLASVWDSCRDALSKNELAVIQTTECNTSGMVTVITTLAHSSGQWIRGKISLKPNKPDPQSLGSALTYGRRYGLSAIVGVAPKDDDDDGNAATNPAVEDAKRILGAKEVDQKKTEVKQGPDIITTKQVQRMFALAKDRGVTNETLKDYCKANYGYESSKDILKKDYEAICDWLLLQEKPEADNA